MKFVIPILLFTLAATLSAVGKSYVPEDLAGDQYQALVAQFGNNKTLLEGYEGQILIALSHYPQLKDVRIKFRFVENGIPLTARPTFWSTVFRSAKKRTYLITIAKDTDPRWAPILFHNLPYNAQIGVIGHEIAHVAEFSERSFWGMLQVLIGNLSKKFMDRLEYNTDLITIRHGLGFQLLAWSTYVREVLQIADDYGDSMPNEVAQSERYMSPATIRRYMAEEDIYALEKP